MKQISLFAIIIFVFVSNTVIGQQKAPKITTDANQKQQHVSSIHHFVVFDINQKPFDFSKLKGKKVMIVNTASRCGYTKQFAGLQELYEKYRDQNFVIIGFPSNDFMNQDPGTNEEILEFCSLNYGVSFPMMSKVIVTGKKKSPVYKFLTDKQHNGVESSNVGWNFQKYLIDENGYLVKVIGTKTEPMDEEILKWIEGR